MIKNKIIQKQTYVFSRWSRKSWACFAAIGKQIKIGVLASTICDKAYTKTQMTGSFFIDSFTYLYSQNNEDSETDSRFEELYQLQLQTISTQQKNDIHQITYFNFNYQKVLCAIVSTPFLFLLNQ